jgi:hypothetical protein
LIAVIISSATGLSPAHSLPSLVSLLFFALTVPLFCAYADTPKVVAALLAGQSLAALHSVLDSIFPNTLPRLFLGEVTESGQLALTILVLLGACWTAATQSSAQSTKDAHLQSSSAIPLRTLCGLGAAVTALLTLLAFKDSLELSSSATALLITGATATACLIFVTLRSAPKTVRELTLVMAVEAPLLLCALLVNLKRGPWLGVLMGVSLFCAFYAKRLIGFIVLLSVAVAFSVQPIHDRIAASYNHFTITGGRSTIWRIGAELAAEYPLGIGYHNSGILRQFALEIPPELKHFHNNFINIVAENGWLAGLLFGWFCIAICRACFKKPRHPMYVAIGCAIVSWQTAGLVEYNFGDSEVMLIVWVLLGLLLQRELRTKLATRECDN